MLTVACVFKTKSEKGGSAGFTAKSVGGMRRAIERNVTIPHRFVCLSNVDVSDRIPLEHDWPGRGWWAKVELFKLPPPVLYFDLDVMIVGNIDHIAEYVCNLLENEFFCLLPYKVDHNNKVNSSIMGWTADLSDIYHNFTPEPGKLINRFAGDQRYIWHQLRKRGAILRHIGETWRVNDTVFTGMYYYCTRTKTYLEPDMHHGQGLPDDASIIICCGPPRFESLTSPDWIYNYYNA